MRTIAVFSFARCGSTNLMGLLASQGARMFFEPFSPIFKNKPYKLLQEDGLASALDWMEAGYDGFKHLSFHLGEEQNLELLRRCRTVFLHRKDLVGCAISLALARATRVYKRTAMPESYLECRVRLKPESVLEIAEGARAHLRYLDVLGEAHVVSYEELYAESTKEEAVRSVLEFCGLKLVDDGGARWFTDGRHKLNPDLRERVENYDELLEFLRDKIHSL
ncbi:MAG: hypothetical protein EBS89_08550 [Proteobacteria bacterium]|nr:hypothetical protein [Pseudomonadota bacterium]